MNYKISASMFQFLLMAKLITSMTPEIQVVSFARSRATMNGPVKCALDSANKTMSSTSMQNCSLSCVNDATCAGFNIKNPDTCEIYNYKPKIVIRIAGCKFYGVAIIQNRVFLSILLISLCYLLTLM